jgi:PAS domain S-box-containing protein
VRQRTIELTQANEMLNREIAGHRGAQEALAQEKERLGVTLRSIGDGVMTTDTRGRVQSLNPVAEQLTGWSQCEAGGCDLGKIFAPLHAGRNEPHGAFLDAALQDGRETEVSHHSILVSRDGRRRTVGFKVSPLRQRDGNILGAVIVVRDTTEHERISAEACRSVQLESLGVLAGGLAHDFNNILTVILGNISLAATSVGANETVAGSLREATVASQQAQNLTRQLLAFSKGGAPVKATAHLQETIRESARFGLHGSNVLAKFELSDELWPAEVDGGQIHQVIHNLVINAVQAMPNGGNLRITARNRTAGGQDSVIRGSEKWIEIAVADDGCGVSPEKLARIFEPYFTTKKKGNGLGLAMCDLIVRNHGGRITVESEIGKGTTFRIHLPASEKPVARQAGNAAAPASMGRGRILVLEDDDSLRKLMVSMFRRLGYQADFAQSGEEAIRVFTTATQLGTPHDAAILDLTIPGSMGGRETMRLLREIRADFPALVSSGSSLDPAVANYREFGFSGVISKPYTLDQFAEALARIIPASRG